LNKPLLKNKLILFKNNKAMICFPNAKINIGLHVTGKRDDGFHNIETLFYPVQLSDILEIIPLTEKDPDCKLFENTGIHIETDPSDNLCVRAWRELNKVRPLPEVKIHLHKVIPHGAGLGGGSSDAAFTLKALNGMFNLNMTDPELASIAAVIGSDCPFFIYNRPMMATGRGEILKPSGINLTGFKIIIVHPGVGVSTSWAYSRIKVRNRPGSLPEIMATDPSKWQGRVINDFESAVFEAYPVIREIRQKLISSGAFYASMTGSGSAVYGLFEGNTGFSTPGELFPGMFVWKGVL